MSSTFTIPPHQHVILSNYLQVVLMIPTRAPSKRLSFSCHRFSVGTVSTPSWGSIVLVLASRYQQMSSQTTI